VKNSPQDTICALSTPTGIGALAVIRMTGSKALSITESLFSKSLQNTPAPFVKFGVIKINGETIDEVVLTAFRAPASFTGEDTVEISCHGSPYIQQRVLQGLQQAGARMAEPGEFTLRAYLNGKMDLSQAEAVADLISSQSAGAHKLAMQQMRGGFGKEIDRLRAQLIEFASLIELELDFAEEDVEFADRSQLHKLIVEIRDLINNLMNSFALGNVIKNGIPVAIVGEPNVGKSTLLNALLNEERAIVSDIPGTTRDTIEDEIQMQGIVFRFIDTAGIRETFDDIERMGIARAFEKIAQATVVLYLVDSARRDFEALKNELQEISKGIEAGGKKMLVLLNKSDRAAASHELLEIYKNHKTLAISAREKQNLEALKTELLQFVNLGQVGVGDVIVTNARHYEALRQAHEALSDVATGMSTGITGDFLAVDIRKALYHLGAITGKISSDDLLESIFRNFCIGK
jgi:tRNA modification GTPase